METAETVQSVVTEQMTEEERELVQALSSLPKEVKATIAEFVKAAGAGTGGHKLPPSLPKARPPRAPRKSVPPLDGVALMHFPSSPVHSFATSALARLPQWKPSEASDFAYMLHTAKADSRGNISTAVFGVRNQSGDAKGNVAAESMGGLIAKGGPAMVKAWYSLWARWYESGCHPTQTVTCDLNKFCADLGYKQHPHGGYPVEHKQEVLRILEALTAVEMFIVLPHPNPKKRAKGVDLRLRGRVWDWRLSVEEGEKPEPGENRVWDPIVFKFGPGVWYAEPEYQEHYRAVGKVSVGLLQLANDTDQWPILMGGYLGYLARVGRYKQTRLRAETILAAVGLAQTDDLKRRSSQMKAKFERSLNRLAEVGVIAAWKWNDERAGQSEAQDAVEIADEETSDAPGLMLSSGSTWRNDTVIITWPLLLTDYGEQLEAMRQQHIEGARETIARLEQEKRRKRLKAPQES